MKKLSLLLTIILFSHMAYSQEKNDSYDILWKKVQKLEDDALTKSALAVIHTIAEKAKKNQNAAQIVKTLLYSSKYAMILEEDSQLTIINDFKSQIGQSEFPTKNILESYLANLYWQFFQQNRYQFYNRTKTAGKVDSSTGSGEADFRTWDLTTLFEEISVHFKNSLEHPSELQKLKITDFKDILNEQPDSEVYRPTLFDLLAHTALQFYKSGESNLTRPTDKFEIDDPEILCETYSFTQLKIDTTDNTSLQSRALLIYQQLLQLHYPEPRMNAFAEVDIERLRYIHGNATFEDKDARYLEVLQHTTESLDHNEVSALYTYEIAALYRQWGDTYQPKVSDEHHWKQKEALELCQAVIAKFPESRGAEKCRALKFQILEKRLQLTTEQHIPIDEPSRLLVDYTNQKGIRLKAYKISPSELKQLNTLHLEPKKRAFIEQLEVAKSWESELRDEGDYQSHKTEIVLPPLANGQYILLAEPKNDADSTFAYSPVQVTDLALVEMHTKTHQNFQVINRNNGKPIAGASVKFTYRKNYNGPDIEKTFDSDAMGMVEISLGPDYWTNVQAEITFNQDKAYYGDYYIDQKYDDEGPDATYASFLFTDRSIYRPGQPIYFKGIAIQRSKNTSSILTNTMVTVTLRDVNSQEVGKQDFKTNEFGSFAGEFILPNSGLTGNFSMEISSKTLGIHGHADFSVEEYKRPKFETSFEPVAETFKVNDSISIKGKALAYAGSYITDAKVTYWVKRVVHFPRWYYWYHPPYIGTSQEIAHGETTTDASGRYQIDFKAIPDNSIPEENRPTFNYEVTADVRDVNGETHSTTTTVRVGYHTLTASIEIPDLLDKDKDEIKIELSTKNLNDQFVPATGTLKMYKLRAPENVLRNRSWEAPDYKGFTKEEFKELYPHDAYDNEHDPKTWEKNKLVWETSFDTGKSKEISLPTLKKWLSGHYVIELETEDKFGQTVKDLAFTILLGDNDKQLVDHQLFQIKTDKQTYDIGDQVEVTLLSASQDLTVSVFVEKNKSIVAKRSIHLNDNSKSFTLPVDAEDLGGFAINYSFSAYNSFQSGSLPISVPYPSTDLEIETLTFRDKLQPSTDEQWSFKIKGPKGEQVAAEVLASMYDASLDAFRDHNWSFDPNNRTNYYSHIYSNARQSYGTNTFRSYQDEKGIPDYTPQDYTSFDWFGFYFGHRGRGRYDLMVRKSAAPNPIAMNNAVMAEEAQSLDEVESVGYGESESKKEGQPEQDGQQEKETSFDQVQIRKNLQETAFFFPQLQTDSEGNTSFHFTTPEALTQWKLQLLAHTKTLESTVTTLETVTQKELMVIPNVPRFLRGGDEIVISTKIANLTKNVLAGQAKLVLVDAVTGTDITSRLFTSLAVGITADKDELIKTSKDFKIDSLGNTQVSWALKIPEDVQAVQYTILAKAGNFSDGEQGVLPVLTNRMLVTETLPMWVRSDQNKTFVLEKLKNNSSTTLKHHKLTLEITSNPAWYAVQALPYLMEYPYDCNEQIFSKYYANTLAGHIANANPRIRQVFDLWRNSDALLSNLEKNQELKALLIEETPWLRDAQSESEQKKRIALLFDLNKMKSERTNSLARLSQNQMSSGAWAWFKGGRENRFITQHIITGLGHLDKLTLAVDGNLASGAESNSSIFGDQRQMVQKAIRYLDAEFVAEYDRMKKYASNIDDDHLSQIQIHYLYMRSFFEDIASDKKVKEIATYYHDQARQYWTKKSLYSKGLLALILHRAGDAGTSDKILRSLKENSITSEELGMYWKENASSWFWYQAPIETQALLIEAFSEITNDKTTVDNLKVWLLKNKQTNQWGTTKATADAVYALLMQGGEWLSVDDAVQVMVGREKITPSTLENVKLEAGTGYFKTSWDANEIEPKMAEVTLSKKTAGIAWGAMYWQYFQDLDKITSAETPLRLSKKLFLRQYTDTGEEISEITTQTSLKVGDLIRVKIELRSDRDMEFVHMKDMRGAGMEPINVLSQFKWQDGLGYYESTKDASTNFFFDYLPKGIYVFEYDLRVNNAGNFSNGITTIQSMYAPEFNSYSEGVKVQVQR